MTSQSYNLANNKRDPRDGWYRPRVMVRRSLTMHRLPDPSTLPLAEVA